MSDVKLPSEPSVASQARGGGARTSARERLALVLSLFALLAAGVGAYGPAERVRTMYSWPPETLPSDSPTRLWYTPLHVAARAPESIAANIPCRLQPALPGAGASPVVLATARRPDLARALTVTRTGDEIAIAVDREVFQRIDMPPGATDPGCAFALRLQDDSWSLEGGPANIAAAGELESMPEVFGVFSELDLTAEGPAPSIQITTIPHDTRPTATQATAWTLSVVALGLALLLVALPQSTARRRPRGRRLLRNMAAKAHPVDAVVALALLGWWVFAPIVFDDGWVQAREQMFASSGGFSIYYTTLGSNLPLDYWNEWAHHWLVEVTNALLILRIPALACLGGIWVLCRWITTRVAAMPGGPVAGQWPLAFGFLIGAFAWGMTLRPEPVTALLFVAVTACMVRFLERETAASLAVAAALIALSLSAHTTGVVALAPVIVAATRLVAWGRAGRLVAITTIVAAGCALLVVLAVVGSDVRQRRLEVELASAFSFESRDEFTRYEFLNSVLTGTPLRRAAVGLLLLTVLAYVLRRRRESSGLLDFPAPVLAVAFVLLSFTPSKWPWHFGALIGVGAVAVACETVRLQRERSDCRQWNLWPFVGVIAAAAVAHWSWWVALPWNAVDLRTLDWYPNLATALSGFALLLPVCLILALVGIGVRRRRPAYDAPWRIAAWTAPLLAIPVMLYTVGILAVDTAASESWTLARQNIRTIAGDRGCGLGDDLLVPVIESSRPLSRVQPEIAGAAPTWVSEAPVHGVDRFVLSPTRSGSGASPWFELPETERFGFFVSGRPGTSDRLVVEWGRARQDGIRMLAAERITHELWAQQWSNAPWRLVASGELPPRPREATVARISFRAGAAPGPALAIATPVVYRTENLASAVGRTSLTLVSPDILPYFPCARLPVLGHGVVESPQYVVESQFAFHTLNASLGNPFRGVSNTYDIERLPVADTPDAPNEIRLYRVQRIDGASVAPPSRETVTLSSAPFSREVRVRQRSALEAGAERDSRVRRHPTRDDPHVT